MKNKGFILLYTIVITLVALIMLLGLNYLIVYGTKMSGISKRYNSALEVAKGGALECLEQLKKCYIGDNSTISNRFKCDHNTNNWKEFISNATDISKFTSHASPLDIIQYNDWQKTYGSYQVFCKIIDTRSYTNGYLYNVEIVSQKLGGKELAWLSVGYTIKVGE